MQDLKVIEKVEMTSLDLMELTGKQHSHIMRDIRDEIEKLGDEVGLSIFGLSSYINSQNKEQPCFRMSKDGAMQMALKYDAKTRYKVIKKIEEQEQEIIRLKLAYMERQTTEWQQTRIEGKFTRRKETDALALLKIYAENQREGKPYAKIYTNYTQLVNKAVGLETGERKKASLRQLQMVSILEDMVENTVLEEMEKGVFFKAIYQKCKEKVETVSSLLYISKNQIVPIM